MKMQRHEVENDDCGRWVSATRVPSKLQDAFKGWNKAVFP